MLGIRTLTPSKRRRSYIVPLASFAAVFFLVHTSNNIRRRSFEITDDFSNEPYTQESKEPINHPVANGTQNCQLKIKTGKLDVDFYERDIYVTKEVHGDNPILDVFHVNPIFENPAIRMNPNKFLLPIVVNGPNNQITGFRETALVALKLNRTLVIPKFFKHISDSQIGSGVGTMRFIHPAHRFEVAGLCRFMSCISMEDFQQTCKYRVDALMHLSRYDATDFKKFESIIGMKITNSEPLKSKNLSDVKLIPQKPVDPISKFRKFRPNEITKLFTTEARCVIYPRPLYNLQFRRNDWAIKKRVEFISSDKELKQASDIRLWQSLTYYSRSPEYITKIAKEFISRVIGKRKFISVHWRYNKDDFMKRCQKDLKKSNKLKVTLCKNALLIKPFDIAMAIEEQVVMLRKDKKLGNTPFVYFAAPPSEEKLIKDVSKILLERQHITTFSSEDVGKFMKLRYTKCPQLLEHFNDIMSTTEMEICTLSLLFLGSERSSWTDNVRRMRMTSQLDSTSPELDGDIFFSSVAMREKRIEDMKNRTKKIS